MATLDEIILQEVNPFNPVSFKSGNFWTNQDSALISVESIHQDAREQVSEALEVVISDPATYSILLEGERGSGKSYLLGYLKRKLNSKAFFVYIEPCPNNEHLWRHTLRYVIDSLMYTPEEKKESQLLIWLKSLPIFHEKKQNQQLLSEKKIFIKNLSHQYPHVDYAQQFFGILYELIKPDNYLLAFQWLKGDDLDEDDLKKLGVVSSINSEGLAKLILGNFGKIADATMPIVICFDQVETCGEQLPDGSRDISGIFNINTTFHNSNFKNFLVIISILSDKLRFYKKNIPTSDLSRIQKYISLKQISLEQVEALWANRLSPLHYKANPHPDSPILPLDRQKLELKFPGGKANLREALNFGGILYAEYKEDLIVEPIKTISKVNLSQQETRNHLLNSFKLIWEAELKTIQSSVQQINEFSGVQLADMLQKTLKALEIKNICPKFLKSSTYSGFSLSYNLSKNHQKKCGIFWHEAANMSSFFYGMNACKTVIDNELCDLLFLLRAEKLGKPNTKGYQLYESMFGATTPHTHIIPSLKDVHYLRTYQKLAYEAESGDLTVNFKSIDVYTLEKLIRESGVLKDCELLQKLGLLPSPVIDSVKEIKEKAKHFLLNLLQKECLLGRAFIIGKLRNQFTELSDVDCEEIVQSVHLAGSLTIINLSPTKPKEQLVAWVPKSN